MQYGYIRAWDDAEAAHQRAQVTAKRPDVIYQDDARDNSAWLALQTQLAPGDTLIVASLDRLGMSLDAIVLVLEQLLAAGITVATGAAGEFVARDGAMTALTQEKMTLLTVATQADQILLQERMRLGKLQMMQDPSFREGRPPVLSPVKERAVLRYLETHTQIQTADHYGVSRATVTRAVRRAKDAALAEQAQSKTADKK
ncbi:recombinase family protein [Lacticaseibacillus mingshuiensis]|uniref:Recombinase family protein n=1 Tax=Lacticaseibacillus mingshuiensis TaxID=2799574 RepID=A0ABW4CKN9_9LACO|nr:recombinase family protein [Lacticaseibacillus mingshuiensis]